MLSTLQPVVERWWSRTLDLLYPRTCVGCGRLGAFLCGGCRDGLPAVPRPACSACGLPQTGRTCAACAEHPLALDRLASAFEYRDVVRTAVLYLKYRGISGLAEELGHLMAAAYAGPGGLVVPVPLHRDRLRERGYNQAEQLARSLARETGFPMAEHGLLRAVATPPQARLTERTQRFRNMEGAFRAVPELVAGHDVLLIDDVATTGATVNACAMALRAAGARSVAAFTFARQL